MTALLLFPLTAAALDYLYQTAEPQKTGWPLTDEERAYVLKPEHERRPGRESNKHLPAMWPVVPSAGHFGGTAWLDTHAKLVKYVEANKGPIDILLVGDSITQQWGSPLDNKPLNAAWQKQFGNYKTINIGIGGDKSQNVLWRLDHGGVAGLEPRLVVVLIGNNNMFFTPETGVEAAAKGIEMCVANVRDKFPKADVIAVKIFPAHAPGNRFYEDIKKTNAALDTLKLDRDPKVHVLDLTADMINADGTLKKESFTPDNIHLSQDGGYGLYAERLKPLVEKRLSEPITWLVQYEAKSLPQEQGWKAIGELVAKAKLANGSLHLVDDSAKETGAFRATWKPQAGTEIVVEAKVRVESVAARRGTGMWPAQQGGPVGLLVSDGKHQEGLLLRPEKIATFHDRVALFDAKTEFHTYQLVIRDRDMSIAVDGKILIRGEGAFCKAATDAEAFVQFGSTSPGWMGDAHWQSVRLGLRKRIDEPTQPQLHITLSEPWDIPPTPGWDQPRHGGHELKSKDPEIGIAAPEAKPGKPLPPTRPYLYDVGQGVLMLSVAQGPDAIFEPYGVLRSTDAGKTWVPVKDLQFKTFAPQPHLRLPDDSILGVSRWNVKYEPGTYVGMSYRFDPKGESFTLFENLIRVPKDAGQIVAFDRDIWDLGNGKIMTATYTRATGDYAAYLLMSTDAGATWNHFSTIGVGPEPSVVRFSDTKMMAILRTLSFGPLLQTWSHDGGQTWTTPIALEEGSVAPDMVLMSNGVLACSYGRPGSNLMFSTDQGQTWIHHTVITDSGGFNYTALREISPGRLLYVHDAPKLKSLYVDVKVTKK